MNNLSVGAIALAVAIGTGAYLGGPAAAQQLQYACDENGDGFVDASESRMCTERAFDELAAGEEVLSEERLGAMGQGEQGRTFSEVDENADGEVSREEWTKWHEQRFTAATQTGESGIPAADYETMEWANESYVRPTPEKPGQNQQ
jgi:EF hand